MHVVITGASSGIGAALALELARAPGARLTLVARREDLLRQVAARAGVQTHVVSRDLSATEHMTDWLEGAEADLGPVEVLVNNAGVQVIGPLAAADPVEGERSLRVNLHAPLRLARAVLPGMLARGRGTIVNVASMAALAPTTGMSYYNAAKAGLAAASEALTGEVRRRGVHVVTVYPGIIPGTDMGRGGLARYESTRLLSLQPTGTPEGLARAVREAIERRQRRVIYPRVNALARWLPAPTRWFMDAFTPPLREPS